MAQAAFNSFDPLPYDIVIDIFGVWYGPAGTAPYSRDWQRFDDVALFFDMICRPTFQLCVASWRVKAGQTEYLEPCAPGGVTWDHPDDDGDGNRDLCPRGTR